MEKISKEKEREEILIENKNNINETIKNGLQNEPKSYINCGCCQITIGIILTYIYIFISIFLNLNNRIIYHKYKFRNNFTLLLIQQFFSLIFFLIFSKTESFKQKTGQINFNDFSKFKYYYLSFCFIFITNMLSSFYGNQLVINVSMYVTLRKLVLVMIFFLDFFFYKKPIKFITIFCIFLITIGTILVSMDDFTTDYFGCLVVLINNTLTIIYVKFSENFKKKTGVTNLKLLVYNSFLSCPILIFLIFISGEYKKLNNYFVEEKIIEFGNPFQFSIVLFMSCTFCVGLIMCLFTSNEKNSSLFTSMLSNCKDIIISVLSNFFLSNNKFTKNVVGGLLIATIGAILISFRSIYENTKLKNNKSESRKKEE